MRKFHSSVVACLMAGCILTTSCVGSFSLFNKYAAWQREMTSNKYVNGIVGFILLPIVGTVTLFIDSVILNTIEFWSGENPVASHVGKTQQMLGGDGVLYAVKTLRNGYEITAPNGEVTMLLYDKASDSWSISQNGVVKELFRYNPDGKSIKVTANGSERDFTLNEQGLNDAKFAASDGFLLAWQ